MRVSVIIVNWNTKARLIQCLESVVAAVDASQDEIIVVDNGSRDGSVGAVEARFPAVRVVANAVNRGYAAANNQALTLSRGAYLFLLNPDAVLKPGSIEQLLAAFRRLPAAGAVTGRLVSARGEDEHYLHAFPTALDMIGYFSFVRRLLPGLRARATRRYLLAGFDYNRAGVVPQPPGACLMVRRSAVGTTLMDEGLPLFFNDVDLCRRIWKSGHKIYYVPQAIVVHTANQGGVSQAGSLLQIEYAVSMLRYFRKHRPLSEFVLLYIVLLLHYALLCARVLLSRSMAAPGKPPRGMQGRLPEIMSRLALMRSFFDDGHPDW